jgi:Cu+-exporting ATPase
LSGDRNSKVRTIAEQLGITEYQGELLPDQKLAQIHALADTHPVAFVGDGVNDAPALARAHVGIAMAGGTDVAINVSDVVILDGALRRIPQAIRLSRLTLRTIRENLFWAFFYNVVAIPIAACGFLTPLFAALAMTFSDVIVIGNSIRLGRRDDT